MATDEREQQNGQIPQDDDYIPGWNDADDEPGKYRPPAALVRKRVWKRVKWGIWLLVMAVIIYFVVQIFIILAPRTRTEVVLGATMTDSLTVTGIVVMESTEVPAAAGEIYYTVSAGQRVAAGGQVAQVFGSQNAMDAMDSLTVVNEELAMLAEAQNTTLEGGDQDSLLGQMQDGVYGMLSAIENGEYASVGQAKNAATLAANKLQIATRQTGDFAARIAELNAQKQAYEQIAVPTGEILAPETGYFVPSSKHDRVQKSLADMEGLTPAGLQAMLAQPATYYGGNVAGHIITDYTWHFFTAVSAKEAEKFSVDMKGLQINFPGLGDHRMPVTVNSIVVDEAADLAMIELFCEYVSPEVLQLRTEKAELVFGDLQGLLIDKNALRLVDIEDEDGLVSTYKGVYIQFGNMVYFKKVEILAEDDFYMLVPSTVTEGVNEVKMYDTVIVDPGGVELYDRKIL